MMDASYSKLQVGSYIFLITFNPNHMNTTERRFMQLKDEEIARQIAKRKLAEQTINWTIILVVVIHILIWVI